MPPIPETPVPPPEPVPKRPEDELPDGHCLYLDALRIDLSGSQFAGYRVPRNAAVADDTKPLRRIAIQNLGLLASPLQFLQAPVDFEFSAVEVSIRHLPDADGLPFAIDLKTGRVTLEIARDNIEGLVRELLNQALRSQRIAITALQLEIEADGRRTLQFSGSATGRKGPFTTTLHVSGRLLVDDQLSLRLEKIDLSGPGIMSNLIARYLQHQLKAVSARSIPLGGALFGFLRLTDIEVHVSDRLRIVADIGMVTFGITAEPQSAPLNADVGDEPQ